MQIPLVLATFFWLSLILLLSYFAPHHNPHEDTADIVRRHGVEQHVRSRACAHRQIPFKYLHMYNDPRRAMAVATWPSPRDHSDMPWPTGSSFARATCRDCNALRIAYYSGRTTRATARCFSESNPSTISRTIQNPFRPYPICQTTLP